MRTRTFWLATALLVTALVNGTGRGLQARQTHDHQTAPPPATAAPPDTAARSEDAMHARMMAEMQARQARLQELVKTMDGATGPAKIETMAAIIRQLVQHEQAMLTKMDTMHAHMMKGGGMQKH